MPDRWCAPSGLSFTYDGFGNLTNQTVTKGTGPSLNLVVNQATNRISTSGFGYDANGNQTATPQLTMSYDTANRMTSATHQLNGTEDYAYDPSNLRVWLNTGDGERMEFRGLGGEVLGTYKVYLTYGLMMTEERTYFAGALAARYRGQNGEAGSSEGMTSDRLGTVGNRYPYGEMRGAGAAEGTMYATYTRQGATNLDYAQNRWYASQTGRFATPDPWGPSPN